MSDYAADPEFDQPAKPEGPCPCGDARCRCRKCHGLGWVQVQQGYAERMVPDPPPEVVAALSPDEAALLAADIVVRRAAHADSWYPCRLCSPSPFYRWAGGHMAANHDRVGCAECIEAGGKRRARTGA